MKRLFWCVLIGLMLLALLPSCGKKEVIRVATDATWPPFEVVAIGTS